MDGVVRFPPQKHELCSLFNPVIIHSFTFFYHFGFLPTILSYIDSGSRNRFTLGMKCDGLDGSSWLAAAEYIDCITSIMPIQSPNRFHYEDEDEDDDDDRSLRE